MLDPLMKGFATVSIKEEENIRLKPILDPQIHSTKNSDFRTLERLILIFNVRTFDFEDQLSIEIIPAGYDILVIR